MIEECLFLIAGHRLMAIWCQMDLVFSKILTEFDEEEMRVLSEQALYEEIKNTFISLTEKDGYVNSLISQIPIKQKILLKKGYSVRFTD